MVSRVRSGGTQTLASPNADQATTKGAIGFFHRQFSQTQENNLLNPGNKQELLCDAALKDLTGEDSFKCFGFAKYIKNHLLGYADVKQEVKEEIKEEDQ